METIATLERWIDNSRRRAAALLDDIRTGHAVNVPAAYAEIATETARFEAWERAVFMLRVEVNS